MGSAPASRPGRAVTIALDLLMVGLRARSGAEFGKGAEQMQRSVSIACFVLVVTSAVAYANPELIRLQTDDKQWVMPGKDYSASRFSTLTQITKDNVRNLRPAWTFSTGTLRGHEGAPLVVGATMYVHTSFPNNVYALDLNGPDVGRIKWKYLPKQDPRAQAVAPSATVSPGRT